MIWGDYMPLMRDLNLSSSTDGSVSVSHSAPPCGYATSGAMSTFSSVSSGSDSEELAFELDGGEAILSLDGGRQF